MPKIRRVGPEARARLKTKGSDAPAPSREAPTGRDGDQVDRRMMAEAGVRQETGHPEVERDGRRGPPAARPLGQGFQDQIGQAVQPVLGDLKRQIAQVVRQQMEQALRLTRQEVDRAPQPIRQQVQDHVEQPVDAPRREGRPPGDQPQQEGHPEGEREASQSPLRGALRRTTAALGELAQGLTHALRGLLQTVRALLKAVASLLLLILVALREGQMAALRPLS